MYVAQEVDVVGAVGAAVVGAAAAVVAEPTAAPASAALLFVVPRIYFIF